MAEGIRAFAAVKGIIPVPQDLLRAESLDRLLEASVDLVLMAPLLIKHRQVYPCNRDLQDAPGLQPFHDIHGLPVIGLRPRIFSQILKGKSHIIKEPAEPVIPGIQALPVSPHRLLIIRKGLLCAAERL